MSKMSELHRELSEQAYDLGFLSIEDAEQHGWRVNYENAKLEPPVVQPELNELKELEKAHEEWLVEKEQVLNDLDIVAHSDAVPFEHKEIVKQAIEFIRKGEV